MRVKMGNCSRDTMADKAITSPKSFPKCSEGNLRRETWGSSELQGPSLQAGAWVLWAFVTYGPPIPLSSACPLPTHTALLFPCAQAFRPQNTKKACAGPRGNGRDADTGHISGEV